MKIMHLLPALSSGGVEQVVLELCEGLSSYGVECLVVSAGGRMVPQIEKTGARHFTHPLEKKRLRLLAEVFSLAKLFRAEQPDIVHVHSRIPGWVAYLAEKILPRTQRPVIVSSFHGVYSVNQYSRIMTRGAAVIAVSRFIRQHILTNYPATDPSLIHVIPNSIDTSSYYLGYRPDAKWIESWKRAFPELEGKFVLCLPARITFWKGQEMIAPIIRNLRDRGIPAHALIVGETKRGKERYRHKLEKLYADAGIDQHVSWLGHRNDLRDIMCIADVVLSLSLDPESFGKTSLEALALGCSLAGFDHGGVGEQLEEYLPEGRIRVGDAAAMADLLAQWYRTPCKPIKPVGSPYLREDMIRAHLDLYRSLL